MIVVHPDADAVAADAAAQLAARIAEAQEEHGDASVVLTGGGLGIALLAALRDLEVEWSRVELWWGDERFVDSGSDDRNDLQARRALLDHVPVDPAQVHPMGALDGPLDVEEAAAAYASALDGRRLDVVLLGMGPEGHVASIFPGTPAVTDERLAFAVRDCPKPPPTRISLGFAAITSAAEVWVVCAGEAKAEAVAAAVSGAPPNEVPAAGARPTRWFLDEAAASRLG